MYGGAGLQETPEQRANRLASELIREEEAEAEKDSRGKQGRRAQEGCE
jgi:hypothetical protein